MGHATSLISRTALCCALALTAAANAQSMDPAVPTQMPPIAPDPYLQGTYGGGAATQGPSVRSIFIGTMAALLAQSLGSGIGGALAQGLGGTITQWFTGKPIASAVDAARPAATPMGSDREMPAGLQAGVAYEVQLIRSDGAARTVDPARHVFRTGDRFQVYYRPTLPGRVNVSNVDPRGGESRIDSVDVAAGQLAALGPYQFVDAKGAETLKLVLEPCSSPVLTAATRGIVKVAATSGAADPAVRISACGDPTTRGLRAKARSIRKTTKEGTTAFALDPLSNDEIRSGQIVAREVRIALQHR